MTEQQLQDFNKYSTLVPKKIMELVPEYSGDEDLEQELYLRLIEFICGDSFENRKGTSWETLSITNCISRGINLYFKKVNSSFADKIVQAYPDSDPVFTNACFLDLHSNLEKVLDTLTEREADILRMRSGMYDGRQHSLSEVGMSFGVNRGKIRCIEQTAILKLKDRSRAKYIKDFW